MRVSPRSRKYSANAELVMQNPVCEKQFAWASVGVPGGARAANMLTRTNADKTTTRLIALLTPLYASVRSFASGNAVPLQAACLPPRPTQAVTGSNASSYAVNEQSRMWPHIGRPPDRTP